MTNTMNVKTGWNEDHTQYTDSLGHTYPKTGESWDNSDKAAYNWNAYVKYICNHRDEIEDLANCEVSNLEEIMSNNVNTDDVSVINSHIIQWNNFLTEFRDYMGSNDYESAARTYDYYQRCFYGDDDILISGEYMSEDENKCIYSIDDALAIDEDGHIYALSNNKN